MVVFYYSRHFSPDFIYMRYFIWHIFKNNDAVTAKNKQDWSNAKPYLFIYLFIYKTEIDSDTSDLYLCTGET